MLRAFTFARICCIAVIFLRLSPTLLAQSTGDIRGVVKDPSGALIPGAEVTASLAGINIERKAVSGSTGEFTIPSIQVGTYAVRVEAKGFKTFQQGNVTVDIGHVAEVDVTLQLGESTQIVTAEASAPLVETTSTQLGAVMNSTSVVNLPLPTRNTYQLLQLQPGVQSEQGYDLFAGSENAGAVSVNGGRGRANNYNVNGGDGNDQFLNAPAIEPVPDAIEEFRVLTNTFDAEYGRNSGSVVNVVTKGGTNEFHGDVYEFFRNTDLNARGFFDTSLPKFNQNQYGGTLGGPLYRNHTFFFVSAEGRNVRQGIPSDLVVVPTAAQRTGDFSGGSTFTGTLVDQNVANMLNARPGCAGAVAAQGGAPIAMQTAWSSIFPNNKIPSSCFDPVAVDLMNQFIPPANVGSNILQTVPVQGDTSVQWTARVDQKLNDSNQLNAYVYYNDDALQQPFARFQAAGADVPGFGSNYYTRNTQYTLTETWSINPSTINEGHFTYFREGQSAFNNPQRTGLVQDSCATVPSAYCFADPNNPDLGIHPGLSPKYEGVPFVSVSGGFSLGNDSEGELPQIGNSFSWIDNLSKVVGTHSLKFGVDIRRMRFDQTLYYNVNGSYSYLPGGTNDVGASSLYADYLLGVPNTFSEGSAQSEHVRSSAFYLFAQDSWKIRPNLTLNYGLRWELNTPMADISEHVQTFRPGQVTKIYPCQLSANNPLVQTFGTTDCSPGSAGESVNPLGIVFPGDQGIPQSLTNTYYHAFAPRIGLAYSPSGDSGWKHVLFGSQGQSSIRMGWGIFYNPIEQLVLEQFSAEPPFGGSISLSNPLFDTPFEAQNGTINPNPFNGILNPPRGQPVDWSTFRPILLYGQFQPNLRTQYAEQYNFTIQRQIPANILIQVGYVGTQGHRLLASHDLNYGNAQTCLDLQAISVAASDTSLGCGPFGSDVAYTIQPGEIPAGFTLHLPYGPQKTVTGPNAGPITLVGLRPYSSPFCNPLTGVGCPPDGVPVFANIFAEDTIANSNYNSLQISAEKRFSHGLQFQLAYTWSKSIDNASSFENELNPLNYRLSRSLSYFDAPNRFVFSYVYQFPNTSFQGIKGKLLNGWQSSGILQFQTGFPVPITSASDYELETSYFFQSAGEPNKIGPFQRLNPRNPLNAAFVTSAFQQPQDQYGNPIYGVFGTSSRTVCCGPGIANFDFSMMKDTKVTESTAVEFRAEFFNIFNHAQFSTVDGNISDGDVQTGGTFGKVTRAREPRVIQLALKLIF
ncbi:MAG: carboxypeptidase regulatory-like domain-containing protein [Acidobacteriaceae bacterium]|nr:carboxypeptidase regulatory-like domain-containing protein [Acidobacteriaceae bacterium]